MDSKTNYKHMLLALLLILAGLAGAIAPQTAAATTWEIDLDYWYRMNKISTYTPYELGLESGKFVYNPHTQTLELHEVKFHGSILLKNKDVTIRLIGKNIVKGHIKCTHNLTIQGPGSLDAGYISADKDLNIQSCSIRSGQISSEDGYLTIYHATVHASSSTNSEYGAIYSDGPIKLEGVSVLYAYPGRFGKIVEKYSWSLFENSYYVLLNTEGEPLYEVIIGPSGAPSAPQVEQEISIKYPESFVHSSLGKSEEEVSFSSNSYAFPLNWGDIKVVRSSSWINVKQVKSTTFIIKCSVNYGEERERDGEVVFDVGGGVTKTCYVRQRGVNRSLVVDPKEANVRAGGQTFDVAVRDKKGTKLNISRGQVPFTPDAKKWLSISFENGNNVREPRIQISVEPNTGPARTGTVVFPTIQGTTVMTIKQKAYLPDLDAERLGDGEIKNKSLHYEAFDFKAKIDRNKYTLVLINVKSRFNCEAEVTEGSDWLNFWGFDMEKNEEIWFTKYGWNGEEVNSVILIMAAKTENNTGKPRTGTVVVRTTNGSKLSKTFTITQDPNPNSKPSDPSNPDAPILRLYFKDDSSAIPAGGGKKEVTVECNAEWSASLPKDCKWLTIEGKNGGKNDGTLTLKAAENTSTESRKATLTVSLGEGDKSQTLEVTQDAKSKPALELEQENTISGSLGSPREVKIRSNVAWKATPTVPWLHVEPSEGTGSVPETLTITADPNESEKGRTGTITIESTDGSKLTRTLTVAQKPAAVAATGISLNPASITMGSGGGMVGFNVYASKGWTISGSPDWMHPDATRGSGTRLVIVRFDRNESGAERTGKLTVKSDDGKTERTFTLTQRASQRKPSRPSDDGTYDYDLALNPEEITVGPSDGAGSTISVATSRLWAGSTTEDWIRLESAVGRGNGSFTFTVAPNPSKEMRHGTITIRTQQGMDELKVAIHQQGRVGDEEAPTRVKVSSVSLDPSSITVNGDLRSKLIGASVYPSNAANKGLLWMSSNPSVATVHVADTRAGLRSGSLRADEAEHTADDYAVVTIVGKGKATIAATASDGSGIVARCEVNVLSTVANTVPYAPTAKVYTVGPTLYLSLPTAETVQVYTLAGTLYRTWQAPAGDTSLTLPLGTYIIKVGQLTEKVHVPR